MNDNFVVFVFLPTPAMAGRSVLAKSLVSNPTLTHRAKGGKEGQGHGTKSLRHAGVGEKTPPLAGRAC